MAIIVTSIENGVSKNETIEDINQIISQPKIVESNDNVENKESNENNETKEIKSEEKDDFSYLDENEHEDHDDNEDDDVDSNNEDETEDETEETPKKKGLSKRLSKLTREKREMQERIERLEKALTEKDTSDSKVAEPVENEIEEPNPEDFDSTYEYQKALAKYNVKMAKLELEAEERKKIIEAEGKKIYEEYVKREQSIKTKYKDYEDAIKKANLNKNLIMAVKNCIITSEYGPDILYYMAKNPDFVKELNSLPFDRQPYKVGKLEAKLESKLGNREVVANKITKAPKPTSKIPEKGGNHSELQELSFADFVKIRESQLKNK